MSSEAGLLCLGSWERLDGDGLLTPSESEAQL